MTSGGQRSKATRGGRNNSRSCRDFGFSTLAFSSQNCRSQTKITATFSSFRKTGHGRKCGHCPYRCQTFRRLSMASRAGTNQPTTYRRHLASCLTDAAYATFGRAISAAANWAMSLAVSLYTTFGRMRGSCATIGIPRQSHTLRNGQGRSHLAKTNRTTARCVPACTNSTQNSRLHRRFNF